MEQDLMDKMIGYISKAINSSGTSGRISNSSSSSVGPQTPSSAPAGGSNVSAIGGMRPFFLYYAPNAIHQ